MKIQKINIYDLIENYKISANNILKNKMYKVFDGSLLIVSENGQIIKTLEFEKYNTKLIMQYLEEEKIVFIPFVSGFDSFVLTVAGTELDLDYGIEADYIEGIGYMPTGGRIIDIGDINLSYRNLAGFSIEKIEGKSYKIRFANYMKGSSEINYIENAGIIFEEVVKYISIFQ